MATCTGSPSASKKSSWIESPMGSKQYRLLLPMRVQVGSPKAQRQKGACDMRGSRHQVVPLSRDCLHTQYQIFVLGLACAQMFADHFTLEYSKVWSLCFYFHTSISVEGRDEGP